MAFGYYKTFTTNSTQCGAANSTNFPICISVTDIDLKTVANGGYVQNANGYDIRPFSDSALTSALTFELVYYNASTGQVEMHVNVGTLSVMVNLVSYLAFGDATISTDGSSTGTWNSNFVAVYHLKDGTTLSGVDSTANANNGTLTNTPTAVAGQIDGAAAFAKASDQYIDLGNPASLQITGNLSIFAWVRLTSSPTTNSDYQLVAKDAATGGRAYTFDISNNFGISGINQARFYINGGGATDVNGNNIIVGNTSLLTATWYRIVGVYNAPGSPLAGYLDIYLNGASDQTQRSGEASSINSATTNVLLARRGYVGFTEPLDGRLDEVRIMNSAVTASWIVADYNNQKASSTFLTWGSRTPVSGGSIKQLAALGAG